jgi:hypothetical protein
MVCRLEVSHEILQFSEDFREECKFAQLLARFAVCLAQHEQILKLVPKEYICKIHKLESHP